MRAAAIASDQRRKASMAVDMSDPLAGDLRGGLTAGLLTLVTTIAYATVAGAAIGADMTSSAVLSGLIGAAVGGVVASLAGPIGVQVNSPRASVAVITASAGGAIAAQLGPDATTLQTLAWLSACMLLAAGFQAAFGVLRLGALIRLVPHCVTSGFTVGIALELVWSQRSVLWPGAALQIEAATVVPLVAGLATVAVIVWMQWQRGWQLLRAWSVPLGFILAIALCEALQAVAPGPLARLQAIDLGAAPFVSLARVFDLDSSDAAAVLPHVLAYALVIAFVNSLETLTCALALEARLQQRFDANRALIASAIGSLAAAFVGGLPVAGSPSTSIANVDAGARTRRSALLAAATVALLAVAGHAALAWIPLAALAGVTLTVAVAMASQPLRDLALQCRAACAGGPAPVGDLIVAVLVMLLLLSIGSAVALLCGVLAASVLAVARMRRGVVLRQYEAAPQVRVIEVGQPLLFANVEPVVQAVEAQPADVRFVVLDLTRASAVDASAARTLADCRLAMAGAGQTLLFVRAGNAAARSVVFEGCLAFDGVGDAIGHTVQAPQAAGETASRVANPPAAETESQRATRLLLPHVGPIAPILVTRAEREAASLEHFYRLLSAQLPTAQARKAFAEAAGRPDMHAAGES